MQTAASSFRLRHLLHHGSIPRAFLVGRAPPTCSPSMANRSMLGVSLDACLKVKLLQSMMRMKPLTCSSGSSIIDSSDSKIALSMSTNVYLGKEEVESFILQCTGHTMKDQ